jgi:hypothetical protein
MFHCPSPALHLDRAPVGGKGFRADSKLIAQDLIAEPNVDKKEGDLISDLRYSSLFTSNGKGKRYV